MQQAIAKSTYHHLLGKKPILFALMFIVFYLTIDFASYRNIWAFTYLLLLVGLVIPFFSIRLGLFYYIIVSLLSDDVSRIGTSVGHSSFASVHITAFGPMTIMANWTLYMGFILALYYVTKKKAFKLSKFDKYMLSLIALYILAGIVGLSNFFQFARVYIHDASYIINTAIAYFLIRLAFRKDGELKKLILVVLMCSGARALVSLAFYLMGIGTSVGRNIKVGHDSGYALLSLLTFFCLCMLVHFSRMQWKYKLLLWGLGFVSLFNIITFSSRGDILTLAFGSCIILVALFKSGVGWKTAAKFSLGLALIVVLSFAVISAARPGALRYLGWKMGTLTALNPSEIGSYSSLSPVLRVIEGLNIFQMELRERSLIWGRGLGSWFTDEYYPFPYLGPGSFPKNEILTRRFFKPHGTQLVLFLKMGLGGFFIYYFIMLLFFRESYLVYQKIADRYWRAITLTFLSFLPVLFYKNFTSKLQIFFGITLAILANIQTLQQKKGSWFVLMDRDSGIEQNV